MASGWTCLLIYSLVTVSGAAICRDSIWSPWINDHKVTPMPFPEENVTEDNQFGGGDVENMNQTARDKFCPPGLGVINRIECETTHGVSYDKTNQTGLICDVEKGFKCYNRRTKGYCKNYQIRLFCDCFVCPTLYDPQNGKLSTTDAFIGASVNISCIDGYTLFGSENIECEENSTWSDSVGNCWKDCQPLPVPADGSLSTEDLISGTNVTVTCGDGFTLFGEKHLHCHNNGSWSSTVGKCLKDCKVLTPPADGSLSTNVSLSCTVTEVSCKAGFTLFGDRGLVCQTNGMWNASVGHCRKDCRSLVKPSHGILSTYVRKANTIVNVSCDVGFTLFGSEKIHCLQNGQWSGTLGTCINDCSDLTPPVNGILSTNISAFNTTVHVTCDSGFSLFGDMMLQCLTTGHWTGVVGKCWKDCKFPAHPSNGSTCISNGTHCVSILSHPGRKVISTTRVDVTCDSGFTLFGKPVLQCQQDGTWDFDVGVCKKDCPTLTPPTNGSLSSTSVISGSTVIISCHSGYTYSGSDCLQCLDDGSWNASVRACRKDPSISVEVLHHLGLNELFYYCDVHPEPNTDYNYTIQWYLSTEASIKTEIKQFDSMKLTDSFRNLTAMTESILRKNGIEEFPYVLSCAISMVDENNTAAGPQQFSSDKFCGIEVLNERPVVLTNAQDTVIALRLTVPFGCQSGTERCFLDLNLFMPRTDQCEVVDVGIQTINVNPCGVRLYNNETGMTNFIRLRTIIPQRIVPQRRIIKANMLTQRIYAAHPIFGGYLVKSFMIKLGINFHMVSGKSCYSHNDPHMKSFDGLNYENQYRGTFILYRNDRYKIQVQIKTISCAHGIWCNCGVAVAAGRDVFVVSKCNTNGPWDIGFKRCDDNVLKNKILSRGSVYIINLPTGGSVHISKGYSLLNVDVMPSIYDFGNTQGLCGILDGNRSNDLQTRKGSGSSSPNLSWRVGQTESLFLQTGYMNLKAYDTEDDICTCGDNFNSTKQLQEILHCAASKHCGNANYHVAPLPTAQCYTLGKVNAPNSISASSTDVHAGTETSYIPMTSIHPNTVTKKPIKPQQVYTKQNARAACLKELNKPVYHLCKTVPGLDLTSYIDDCAKDAVYTNSMVWAVTHLEGLKDICKHQVQINQPLPPEVLSDKSFTDALNDTDVNPTDATTPLPTTKPVHNAFSPEFLANLEELSCLNECSGQGNCVNGTCNCSTGFVFDDCSINLSKPPPMYGIPDRGICDLTQRPCIRTSVLGEDFFASKTLLCNIKAFKVTENSTVVYSLSTKRPATRLSFAEVVCPLDNDTFEQISNSPRRHDTYIARGYSISITNDGKHFGEPDSIVIFNSSCVNCTKTGNQIECLKDINYCVWDGSCYNENDTIDGKHCKRTEENQWTFDCRSASPPTNGKLLTNDVTSGAIVEATCHNDFTMFGNKTVKCMWNGEWSGNFGTCFQDCEVLHPPTNGSLSTNIRIFGTKVNVSCDAGFTLPVQNILYCQNDGQWNGPVGVCWRDCKYPTQPSNGTLCITNGTHCISKTSSPGRLVNSTTRVDVKCDRGFTLFGAPAIKCQTDGEWNFHVGVCKKDCPTLTPPNNGSISSTNVMSRSSVTISCDSGYTYSGSYSLQCLDGGIWNATVRACRKDPSISVEVLHHSGQNEIYYYCDVYPEPNTDYNYTIHWYLSNETNAKTEIKRYDSMKLNESFWNMTAMTESILKNNGVEEFPYLLACAVSMLDENNTASGPQQFSKDKFCGIEIVDEHQVVLTNTQDAVIAVKLTVPFGCHLGTERCFLDLNVFMPRTDQCEVVDVGIQTIDINPCGVRFYNNETGLTKYIRLRTIITPRIVSQRRIIKANMLTQQIYAAHPIFGGYFVKSVLIKLGIDFQMISGKSCYSHNDPHMKSFDGVNYENQNEGTFILYKNERYKIQVQIKTIQCYSRIWCNCGVAVAVGRDVFVVSKCNPNGPWDIGFKRCDDNILTDKILTRGSVYTINLPMGGRVQISKGYSLLNVDVMPSAYDFGNTQGLCGLLDGDRSNDRQRRNGSRSIDSNLSWRVNAAESIFMQTGFMNLKAFDTEDYICTCGDNSNSTHERTALLHCASSKHCENAKYHVSSFPTTQCSTIGKVNTPNTISTGSPDVHTGTETSFIPTSNIHSNTITQKPNKPQHVYTMPTAREACLKELNKPIYHLCKTVPGLDLTSYIEDCAKDAIYTHSMDWALTHLEGLKDICKHQVQINQPLPPDVLTDKSFTDALNDTGVNSDGTTTPSPTKPVHNAFSPEFLANLEEISCLNECSGKGNCINGTCSCSNGYVSDDCSINLAKPPLMYGIPDRGLCDLTQRPCTRTSVLGEDFFASKTLLCNMKAFKVTENSTVVYSLSTKRPATRLSFAEVVCPLDNDTFEHISNSPRRHDTYIARGYSISITNDGKHFGESDSIVIFNSSCVNCTKTGNRIDCRRDINYCVWDGRCYDVNDTVDGKHCKQTEENKWTFDCRSALPPTNGMLLTNDVTSGVAVKATCHKGYTMFGNKTVQCLWKGEWSGNFGKCFKDCEGLHPPANGTTSTKLRTFGTNVTISCNAGFTPSVKETLYCQKDGHWNGSVGVCWKDCPTLPPPANGSLCTSIGSHCIPLPVGGVSSKSKVHVSCDQGFSLFGKTALQCRTDGEWNFAVGTCKKDCPSLTPPNNGSLSQSRVKTGSIVTFSCVPGFTYFGPHSVVCLEGGFWNTTVGNCRKDPAEPSISVEVVRHAGINELFYYCDIIPEPDTDYNYTILWNIANETSTKSEHPSFEPMRFDNEFRKSTALTESKLKSSGVDTFPYILACAVSIAYENETDPGSEIFSKDKFCGIEIINKLPVVLQSTKDAVIDLRLTVPFGCPENTTHCYLNVNVFMPRSDRCEIADVGIQQNILNPCGVRFSNNETDLVKSIRLQAIIAPRVAPQRRQISAELVTQNTYNAHPIFEGYHIKSVGVNLNVDVSLLSGKSCYSHNDPHMKSFDGLSYENQNDGTFILYKNDKYRLQVQIKTRVCSGTVRCNCGVAVAAGRDVFVVNKCNPNGPWDIGFKRCDDKILTDNILIRGSVYTIVLPTGGNVLINKNGWLTNFINIDITPSAYDFGITEGLCGILDENRANDFQKRKGSRSTDPNLSWRVDDTESLFVQRNYANLQAYDIKENLCTCGNDATNTTVKHESVQCTSSKVKHCSSATNRIPLLQSELCSSHGTVTGPGSLQTAVSDLHASTDTSFIPTTNFQTIGNHQTSSHHQAYNMTTGRAACWKELDKPVFRLCQTVPGIEVETYIDDCAKDAVFSSSMDWALTHLEGLKLICKHQVQINQPLPPELLTDKSFIGTRNATSIPSTVSASSNVTKKSDIVFTPEFLAKLEAISCLNECSGEGNCSNGICDCHSGFVSDDCSINVAEPPPMYGIPDRGLCDLTRRQCIRTSVLGENFIASKSLMCNVTSFQVLILNGVTENSTIVYLKSKISPASRLSFAEVICQLENETTLENIWKETAHKEAYIARGYSISITNDGVHFGESDSMLIYNSSCVNCTKAGNQILCDKNFNFCVWNSACYNVKDTVDCKICKQIDGNRTGWSLDPACEAKVPTYETVYCPPLSLPMTDYVARATAGTIVNIKCHPGFTVIGDKVLQCLNTGRWNGTVGSCRKDCQDLPQPESGRLSIAEVGLKKTATLTCKSGYTLFGEHALQCITDGRWNATIGVCKKDCPTIFPPTNGSLSSTTVEYNTIVSVTCEHSFTLFGNESLKCLDNGIWNASVGTCRKDPQRPTIQSGVLELSGQNQLQFFCDFARESDTDHNYTITWFVLHDHSQRREIWTSGTRNYDRFFLNETAFTEHILQSRGYTKLPYTIQCAVSIMYDDIDTRGPLILSQELFCGIEVVGDKIVTLRQTQAVTIHLRLTVPFGCPPNKTTCSLDVNTFMPKSEHCEMADVGIQLINTNPCGVRFLNNETGILKPLKLQATLVPRTAPQRRLLTARLFTQRTYDAHPVFEGYQIDSLTLKVEVDGKLLSGKSCYSHNDPHMKTFDGAFYENQNDGTFILYSNVRYGVQVQIKTSKCPNWRIGRNSPWCNCGVAIAAGRDVLVVSKCDLNGPWDIGFKSCKDEVLKISARNNNYIVTLPTGGNVLITRNGGFTNFINVDVTPSTYDYGISEGLCGVLDNDRANDHYVRNGSTLTDPNLSWRVQDSESLFVDRNFLNLKPYNTEEKLCNCGNDPNITADIQCSSDKVKQCNDSKVNQMHVESGTCSVFGNVNTTPDIGDTHTTMKTSFIPKTDHKAIYPKANQSEDIYNETSARQACIHAMDRPVFSLCKAVPDLDVEPYIDSCAKDAMLTNSMDWSLTHLEGLKDICNYQVQINQPLPPVVLKDKSFTDYVAEAQHNNTISITSTAMTVPKAFTPEYLRQIEAASCLNECSGKGTCNKGTCNCNEGFVTDDCSINLHKPPLMNGIPELGLCDLTRRQCSRTSVLGEDFYSSENLICKLIPFLVTANSSLIYSTAYTRPATRLSFAEVICPLLNESVVPADLYKIPWKGSYIARGYTIAIANDGIHNGDSDSIVIYDSTCVNCTKVGNNVTCTQTPTYCMSYGRCFDVNVTIECKICSEGLGDTAYWKNEPACIPATSIRTTAPSAAPSVTTEMKTTIHNSFIRSGPKVSVEVSNLSGQNQLHFYCDFVPIVAIQYNLSIQWFLSTESDPRREIVSFGPRRLVAGFRNETSLTESHLKEKGIKSLPFTISCAVSATKYTSGSHLSPRFSNELFCGIEIINRGAVLLNTTQAANISIRLTVPFGCQRNETKCYLDINVFMSRTNQCDIADVGLKQTSPNRCGIRFFNNETGVTKKLTLQAITVPRTTPLSRVISANFATQSVYKAHPIFGGYTIDTLDVRLEVNGKILSGRSCYSHNDPHIKTFDGPYYENHNEGTFILYNNDVHKVQVQIKTSKCPRWRDGHKSPWCNCGVAVAVGRDVFVVSKCDEGGPWDVGFKNCEDDVLKGKVLERESNYMLHLPTGGTVLITRNGGFNGFINVDITPSIYDYGVSDGLCGVIDGTTDNDPQTRPGSTANDTNLSWRVNDTESLFVRANYGYLEPYGVEEKLCTCGDDTKKNDIQCDSSKVKVCNNPHYHISPLQNEECPAMRTDEKPYSMHDTINYLPSNSKTSFSRATHNHHHGIYPKIYPSGKVYNVTTARLDCLTKFNTRVFQICQRVPDFDVEPYIDSCSKDAMLTNSMDWSMTHLEGLKDMCKHQIEISQPLPHDILSHTNFTSHDHHNNVNVIDHSDTIIHASPVQNVKAHEFLDFVEKLSCLNECSGHGSCVNGTCDCNDGFATTDCSIDVSKPPEMNGIPDEGLCDVSRKQCMKTSVLGDNFVASENLTCNVTAFYVTYNGTYIYSTPVTLPAKRMSFAEVTCPLEHANKLSKREALLSPEEGTYVARGYSVSISNDAVSFGDTDAMVVFDSTCVNCTKLDIDIVCTRDHEYCMMDGRCYSVGDTLDCDECQLNGGPRAEWVINQECLTTTRKHLEPRHSSTAIKELTTKADAPAAKSSSIGNVALIAIFGSVFLLATFIVVLAMCMVYRTKSRSSSPGYTGKERQFKVLPRPKYVCSHETPPPYNEEYEMPAPDYDKNEEPDPDYEEEEDIM